MDNKDIELQFEENRALFIKLDKSINLLRAEVVKSREEYVAPKEEVTVKGQLTVNTEKSVEVENLDQLDKWLERTSKEIAGAIENSKTEPITELTIKNIEQAVTKNVAINNLSELAKMLEPMVEAIEKKEIKTIVQKQDIVFPTSPNRPIPVRLSDGKSFYNAIFNAIAATAPIEDPLAGYQITDADESTATKYYGYANKNGHWYILKESSGSYRYAKGAPLQNGGGLYVDAWNNKNNLEYDYYFEVF